MSLKKKRVVWIIVAALLVGAAGGGYAYYRQTKAAKAQAQTTQQTLQTTRVRRGEIVLSATGAGSVVAAREMGLAFGASGELIELSVGVGDTVKQGDVLARVEDTAARQAVTSAEQALARAQADLKTAQKNHADLIAPPTEVELLTAQAAVETAQKNLDDLTKGATAAEIAQAEATLASAEEAYKQAVAGPTEEEIQRAELALEQAKNSRWSVQMNRDATCGMRPDSSACDQAQAQVLNAEISVQLAEMNLADVKKGKTQAEIQALAAQVASARENLQKLRAGATQAEIDNAKAQLAAAQEKLADLQNGPTAEEIAISEQTVRTAELAVAQAEANLAEAKEALERCTLVAPFDGVITAVNAQVGDTVNANATVLTIADLSQVVLEVYLDETDWAMVNVGYEVEVTFDALPDQVFKGKIVRVSPQLVTVSGVKSVYAQAVLDSASFAKPQTLPVGLSATVDVIGGRATNALVVPVEALREIGANEYAVFVVENGQPRLRPVEVGLMDATYAEIKAGLQEGEIVSTGVVETK